MGPPGILGSLQISMASWRACAGSLIVMPGTGLRSGLVWPSWAREPNRTTRTAVTALGCAHSTLIIRPLPPPPGRWLAPPGALLALTAPHAARAPVAMTIKPAAAAALAAHIFRLCAGRGPECAVLISLGRRTWPGGSVIKSIGRR